MTPKPAGNEAIHRDGVETISATISAESLNGSIWDAVVVGAGPAGGMAASLLARVNLKVLLVEAKPFPRHKVCGGCLNQRALHYLDQLNVTDALRADGAVRLNAFHLRCGNRSVTWETPELWAASRFLLDQTLARQAIKDGADFLPSTKARVVPYDESSPEPRPYREVVLHHPQGERQSVLSRVVICGDGISHSSLRETDAAHLQSHIEKNSRIGIGAIIDDDSSAYPRDLLTMAVGRAGYVGLTRVERGRLNIAAAVDPHEMQHGKPAADVIAEILDECRLPIPAGALAAHWMGTPLLTRSTQQPSDYRLFLIGDATGYVEPFTGEGMAWALASAAAVVPFAVAARSGWTNRLSQEWKTALRRNVVSRQWICRWLAKLLRHPRMAGLALGACRIVPIVPRMAMSYINRTNIERDRTVRR